MKVIFHSARAFAAVIAASLLASCASTPESRIARNPGVFNALDPTDQTLVRDGRLRVGMSKEAVILAMGRPSRRLDVVDEQAAPREVWLYTGSRQIMLPARSPAFVPGPYGRGYWHDPWPQVAHVHYVRARLEFEGNSLRRWEAPIDTR